MAAEYRKKKEEERNRELATRNWIRACHTSILKTCDGRHVAGNEKREWKKRMGVGVEAGVKSSPCRSSEEMAGESRGEAPHACQFTSITALDCGVPVILFPSWLFTRGDLFSTLFLERCLP